MALAEHELARTGQTGVELRNQPARVRWSFEELTTRDGHRLRCELTCSVQALDSPTERRMLSETFLSDGQPLTTHRVAEHFAPAFRAAIEPIVSRRDAEECLQSPARDEMLQAVRQAGARVAFSCGLELLAPFELHTESPTLRQQRLEQALRTQAQQRQRDQLAHAEWAAQLLKQFEPMRHALPPGKILQQFSPADQGQVFEVLTQAGAAEAHRPPLWLVSGNLLVRVDPRAERETPQMHELPAEAGPLRSVQPAKTGDRRLLIGAMSGVIVVDPVSPGTAVVYRDEEIASQRGFTRAVIWREMLWACHSDRGIVAWKLDEPDAPAVALRPPQLAGDGEASLEPRHLLPVDDARLLFSAGGRLVVLTADQQLQPLHLEPRSEIVELLDAGHHLIAVHAGGEICRRSRLSLEMTDELMRGEALQCAAAMPWLGDMRLLLGATHGGIRCVSMEDPLVTEYTGWRGAARALSASADLVAALSPDRQRIVLWETWQNRQPRREIHLAGLTRHRIADLQFAQPA
jgi:hypothetical protein